VSGLGMEVSRGLVWFDLGRGGVGLFGGRGIGRASGGAGKGGGGEWRGEVGRAREVEGGSWEEVWGGKYIIHQTSGMGAVVVWRGGVGGFWFVGGRGQRSGAGRGVGSFLGKLAHGGIVVVEGRASR